MTGMLSSIAGECVCGCDLCICVYIYIYYRIESPIKIAPKSADDTSEFEDYDDDEVILPSPPHRTTPPLCQLHSVYYMFQCPQSAITLPPTSTCIRNSPLLSDSVHPLHPYTSLLSRSSGAGCLRAPRPTRPAESVRQVLAPGMVQDYVT